MPIVRNLWESFGFENTWWLEIAAGESINLMLGVWKLTNVAINAHDFREDLENVRSALEIWESKFNLTIQTSRAQQCRVECIRAVGCHQHFNVSSGVESIELGIILKHGELNLIVSVAIFS